MAHCPAVYLTDLDEVGHLVLRRGFRGQGNQCFVQSQANYVVFFMDCVNLEGFLEDVRLGKWVPVFSFGVKKESLGHVKLDDDPDD